MAGFAERVRERVGQLVYYADGHRVRRGTVVSCGAGDDGLLYEILPGVTLPGGARRVLRAAVDCVLAEGRDPLAGDPTFVAALDRGG
jgi:hypothetical protein